MALPQTCRPTVWLWSRDLVYSGPALNLTAHQLPVWCLVVGMGKPLTLTVDDGSEEARSFLIPPRTTHHLFADPGSVIASAYLDPAGERRDVRGLFAHGRGVVRFGHTNEGRLVSSAPDTKEGVADWLDSVAPRASSSIDPRIRHVTSILHQNPSMSSSAASLAHDINLSESRLLHLFHSEIGTSFRAYRTWARMLHGARCVGEGQSLTAAAAASGFASPSHLADRFKRTFGITASTLLGRGLRIQLME